MTIEMYRDQILDLIVMYEEGWLTLSQYCAIANHIMAIATKAGLFF